MTTTAGWIFSCLRERGLRVRLWEPAIDSTKTTETGAFTDVTEKAGLGDVGWASAVCVGDYNNDGFEDLFCTYYGQASKLFRNNGDGTFTDVTKHAGLINEKPRWGAGCTFVDYNRDGHLDLFVSNYLEFDLKRVPKPGENRYCTWKGGVGAMTIGLGHYLAVGAILFTLGIFGSFSTARTSSSF